MAVPGQFPPYQIEFVRAGKGSNPAVASATQLSAPGVITVLGPHTLVLTGTTPRVQVTLDRNGITANGGPNLVVTFTDLD